MTAPARPRELCVQHYASSFVHRCACVTGLPLRSARDALRRLRCVAVRTLKCCQYRFSPVMLLHTRSHARMPMATTSQSVSALPPAHRRDCTALPAALQRPGLCPRPLLRLVKLGRHGDCGGGRRRRAAATKKGEQQTRRVRTGGWGARSHGRGAGRRQRDNARTGKKKKFSNGLGQVNRIKRGLTLQICERGSKGMRGDTAII